MSGVRIAARAVQPVPWRPPAAIGYNAFTVLSLPFIGYSYLAGGIQAFRLGEPLRVFVHHRLIWALLVGIVAFWTLRNVPVGPLTVLAP